MLARVGKSLTLVFRSIFILCMLTVPLGIAGASAPAEISPLNSIEPLPGLAPHSISAATLMMNSFWGGPDNEWGHAIAVDSSHNVYIVGSGTANTADSIRDWSGGEDAFVVKIGETGPIWNTFLGSSAKDIAHDVGVDPDGNVYVAGESYATWESPKRPHAGGADGFYAKLDPDGNLLWNTFVGGGSDDRIYAETGGSSGLFVAGRTQSSWTCLGSDTLCTGTVHPYTPAGTSGNDGFVARFDHDGNLIWNTFLGSSAGDGANSITVDPIVANPSIYVAGASKAAWGCNPVPECTVKHFVSGNSAFVAQLNLNGSLIRNTFLGDLGDAGEQYGMAQDAAENIYISGWSYYPWSCDTDCTVRDHGNNLDAFAAKLDSALNLTWNTFLGGDGQDDASTIALDDAGDIYVAGTSDVSWGTPLRAFTTGSVSTYGDGFAAKLSPSGALAANTFLGGAGDDGADGIAVDSTGQVVVTGSSNATWGSPMAPFEGGFDAYAALTDFGLYITSAGGKDGWVLESSETSGVGGSKNAGATTLRIGDEAGNEQYRAILSFNTSDLPDNAVIESATLQLRSAGRVGSNPFKVFGNLKVDVRKGAFGSLGTLQLGDFKAAAHHTGVMSFTNTLVNSWYVESLADTEFNHLNALGQTQFRLRFPRDDNNDSGADYLKLYSGNASAAVRPRLIIIFTVP